MFSGAVYPATSSLISNWSTPTERTFFGSFIYAGGTLGVMFGTILPAIIIKHSSGWDAVFHYFGVIGMLVWFPLWIILCYNCPKEHPFISDWELNHLEQSREEKNDCKKGLPWGHILKSKPFWAFTISMLGFDWTYYTLTNDLPKYMSQVIQFSLENSGYLCALPHLSMWLSSIMFSWLANLVLNRKWLSKTNTRKILTAISIFGPAIFVLGASYAGCDKSLVVLMLVIGMVLMGSACSSIFVNPIDLSPKYSGTIMAAGNGIAAAAGIISPYLVGILTPNQTVEEWKQVFYIGLSVALVTTIYILLNLSADVQDWNDPDFDKKDKKIAPETEISEFKKVVIKES